MTLKSCKISELKRGDNFWISSKKSCQLERTKLTVMHPDNAAVRNEVVLACFTRNVVKIPFQYPNDLKVMKICM